MGSGWSGAPYRGLRDDETAAGVARDVFLVLALVLAGGVTVAIAVERLLPIFDREHPMHTLPARAATPSQAASLGGGKIFASGVIRATAGDEPSLCVIRHEAADGVQTRFSVNSNAAFHLENDGPVLPVRAEHIVFQPPRHWLHVDPDHAVRWRSKLPRLPAKGQVFIRCFDHDETVFVDAPVGRDESGAMAVFGTAANPMLATTGDGLQPRIDWLALQCAVGVPALGFGGVLLLYLCWLFLRASWLRRAWLRRWARSESFRLMAPNRFVIIAIVLACAAGLAVRAWGEDFKYWSGPAFALLAVVAGLAVLRQRRAIAGVAGAYLGAKRKRIAEARGRLVALHVKVASDAETEAAPLSGESKAFWSFALRKLAAGGEGAVFHAGSSTRLLVSDSDGGDLGVVDLDGALLDLATQRRRLRRGADGTLQLDPRVAELLPDDLEAELAKKKNVFFVEESSLDPGDELSLYGDMQVEMSLSAGESYRGDAEEMPVVTPASSRNRLLAVGGPPETVARLARRQLSAAMALSGGFFALAALLVGVAAFLMSR